MVCCDELVLLVYLCAPSLRALKEMNKRDELND